MRLRLIKKQTIENYSQKNSQSALPFTIGLNTIKYAEWELSNHIKSTFGSADLLGNGSNRVVFNIGGNNFRMICKYHFGDKFVHLFVCWIGTHKEYDKICDKNLQYTVNAY